MAHLRHLSAKFGLVWLTLCFLNPAVADEAKQTEAELENLRNEINALNTEIQRTTQARDSQRKSVSQAEKDIVEIRTRLRRLDEAQSQTTQELDKLQVRLQQKREDVADSTGELIAQLRSAYVHGTQGAIQLLLNSNDPVSMARDTTYFGYLARHRRSHLQRLRRVLNELGELDRQFKQKLQEQLGLEDEARAALVKLEGALQSRQEALATLEQKLKSQDQQAERLAVEEAALTQLLQELRDLLSEYPVQTEEAFAGLKGALQWPLPGQLIHDFGQPRAPKMRWQGLVIGATEGSRVRSIARGRVSYADWLPGMGQLVIVDHGGGYMSLYGYNQLLTRAVGDWVAPGDTIALVGDTGGQIQSSLYFEIRAGGQPQNPHTWFKSSLPAPK